MSDFRGFFLGQLTFVYNNFENFEAVFSATVFALRFLSKS